MIKHFHGEYGFFLRAESGGDYGGEARELATHDSRDEVSVGRVIATAITVLPRSLRALACAIRWGLREERTHYCFDPDDDAVAQAEQFLYEAAQKYVEAIRDYDERMFSHSDHS